MPFTIPYYLKRRLLWPVITLLIGAIVISLMYLRAIQLHTSEYYIPLISASIELRVHTSEFHIWLEEALLEDATPDQAWDHLVHADAYASVLHDSISSSHHSSASLIRFSLQIPELDRQVQHIMAELKKLRSIGQQRMADPKNSGIGTEIDQSFDKVYADIMQEAQQIETTLRVKTDSDIQYYEHISMAIYVLIALLALLMVALLQHVFKLRASHAALDASNQSLNHKNSELLQQIAARRQAESKLKDSEARLRTILTAAPDAIITIDAAGEIVEWNHGASKIFGYSEEESIGKAVTMIIPEPYRHAHKTGFARHLKGMGSDLSFGMVREFHGLDSDGHKIALEVTLSKWQKADQHFFTAILRDISIRKKAEAELRKISACIEQTGESIVITDRRGIIEYVNPAFTRITGYSTAEAIGQSPRILKSGNYDSDFYEQMWAKITSGKVWEGRITDRRKDGSFYPAMLTISPVNDEQGNITHFIGIQENLTELQKLEDQFVQAQKMEAIGTLVGGIAHNFNNALAGMTGNLYLAKSKVSHMPDVVRHIANVEELAMHSAEMVSQLMVFARNDISVKKATPLTGYVKEVMKQLHLFVPEKIDFSFKVSDEDMQVQCDASQLHQIIMNLINNAIHATKGSEQPCISARLDSIANNESLLARHSDLSPTASTLARLCIKDNGYGISAEHMEHIFEPFFTIKPVDEGTGLGLAMTYGSVKSHGGAIEVDSEAGVGTEICILLPIAESTKPELIDSDIEIVQGQGETILIVDDEQSVRDTTSDVLSSLGYRTITAVDGEDAIETFRRQADAIDLVLLDVVMPHLGGVQVAPKLAEIKPDVKILFSTGYDMSSSLQLIVSKTGMQNVLMKPASIEDMSTAIHLLLAANGDEPQGDSE